MSNDWHGYPQHPDAHPELPWWRKEPIRFRSVRSDGKIVKWQALGSPSLRSPEQVESNAKKIDPPPPPPPPRCGQVWADIDGKHDAMVVRVIGGVAWMPGNVQHREWPPERAVLVAGPGAPWAPMGGSDA